MSEAMSATRLAPLEGRLYAANSVTLAPAPAATRIVLRTGADGRSVARKILQFALPQKPKSTATKGSVSALWIGPDEWLVIDEKAESALAGKFAGEGNDKLSAVDISHRNTAIIVSGEKAADAINCGCPQNLSIAAFPVGAASRTVLGKAEIVLYRTADNEFRLECWRSFSDYVWKFLVDAVKSV